MRATDSDHLTEYIDVKLQIIPEKPLRREILNFKNKKYQAIFKSNTTNTYEFTDCFKSDLSLEIQIEKIGEIFLKSIVLKLLKRSA